MPEGWSVRTDVDGVEWYTGDDGNDSAARWYYWGILGERVYGVPVWPAQLCPHCNEKHPPPFSGGCLV